MKYVLILLLCAGMAARGQNPPRRDTLHFAQWRQEIVRVPVLTGGSQPIVIVPNRGQYCFDKQLSLKMTVGHHDAEQNVYLDTRNGLTGILPPSSHGAAVLEIMPQMENFTFTVMSMKGNIYMYKNQKSKSGIEHWVRTGNSQNFLYQSPTMSAPSGGAGVALARKAESRTYCDGKITAQAYKYGGGTNTWYVYGDRYPAQLRPRKFLGPFGVGYMYTDEGLYLIMEVNFGANYVRIGSMENVQSCFDPSSFRVMEDAFVTKRQEEIQHEEAKADEEEAHAVGECAAEKQAIVDLKKEINKKQADLLRNSQHGNLYQDPASQKAIIGMMDPLDNVRQSILNAKLRICGAEKDMMKYPAHAPEDGLRIGCLGRQVTMLQDAQARMMEIDNQYPTQPARANTEKSKLYWEVLNTIPKCD
ncbi:MAG TPA: hypothetical protein VHC48_12710 [Puia sp.]|nr:hypothetical protein [Puia sp.]